MSWFKCLAPDHPIMEDIFNTFGAEGYGYACIAINQAFLQKVYKIDITRLSRWLNIRAPKAQKLLPLFQKLLADYERITQQSERNPKQSERITQQSERITSVTTPQNPHGSTHDLEKRREEQSREETTTPLPPIAESESLATENLGSGSGVFFEIENKGQRLTEDEWIYRNIMEHRRNKGWKSQGAVDLQSLISLYPNHLEQFRSWATLPMAKRIAAYAFAAIKVTPDNHFKYALKMAREGTGDEFEKFLYQAQRQVEAKDYLVRIS